MAKNAKRKQKPFTLGVLTGGGDCPGLNAAIRAIVRRSLHYRFRVIGILEGWRGLLANLTLPLTLDGVSGILHVGGTILKTSRTNPLKNAETKKKLLSQIKRLGIDALIAIGGEGTLAAAAQVSVLGVPIIGIPKTIDNDLPETDQTIGFDTAISIATEAIDRIHSTAESHNRVMIVEVMGRDTGWIATYAGLAAGADMILIPEKPVRVEAVAAVIRQRHDRGKSFSIVVVAEGTRILHGSKADVVVASPGADEYGHLKLGGVGQVLAKELENVIGFECRVTVLGHIQRGGSPTAFDRILASRFGIFATDLAAQKKFGKMAVLKGNRIKAVSLLKVLRPKKTVDLSVYEAAQVFFG